MKTQYEISQEIVNNGYNIVTCGHCGSVVVHDINVEDLECPHCAFKSDICDFPDLFTWNDTVARLEYLRQQIRDENISYGEIAELQDMVELIDDNDIELLQWAKPEGEQLL